MMGFPLAAVDPPVTDNRAGQIAWHCNTCHQPMDVGHERFLHPTFIARCYDCTVKETP